MGKFLIMMPQTPAQKYSSEIIEQTSLHSRAIQQKLPQILLTPTTYLSGRYCQQMLQR